MNKKLSKIWGVGLALVLALALMVPMAVQAKTLDWGEEDLPVVQTSISSGKMIQPVSDILSLSAANDGKTVYAAVSDEAGTQYVFRSTDGGTTWWKKTPSSGVVSLVAASPDDPLVVVAAGTISSVNYVWVSTDKGETWSSSDVSSELYGAITSVDISEERDDTRWVAVGSDNTSKCLAVAKAEAFAGWDTAGGTSDNWSGWVSDNATNGVMAVAFSPEFGYDNTLLAVTSETGHTWLQAAEVADTMAGCYFNADSSQFATGYPVEIYELTATAGTISLPDTYYGVDSAERIVYIGTDVGAYRVEDIDSTRLKSGDVPYVAYNSEDNKLLIGYGSSGRVDMSENPDSGSPTFTRSSSMKGPSGEGISGVAWVDSTMMCSSKDTGSATADDESAISVSSDATAWNQLSLIDTDLNNITDIAVSPDGATVYVASINSEASYYSIFRYADEGWVRVLCDDVDTGTTSVLIELAPEKPEAVFVALKGTQEVRRSVDSGETWKQSRSDIDINAITVKDDQIVFTVNTSGYVSTSKDGGRTFADYVKSLVYGHHMTMAPNGDLLIAGQDQLKSPSKISVARSTDDGATWSRMAMTTGLSKTSNPVLVAADTDFEDNGILYVAHTDGDEANILRWEIDGDYEEWADIGTAYYTLDDDDVIYGLRCVDGVLYILYYNSSDGDSGFMSTNTPTIKRTSVTWGGGGTSDTVQSGAIFNLQPQALETSEGSIKLWAIDTSGNPDKLYSYTDILAKVEAPTLVNPSDAHVATVDSVLKEINPVRFSWEEVDMDVSYQLRIATNAAVSQNYITYSPGTSEFLTVRDGANSATDQTYAFVGGETYYWKVRVSVPTIGPWSETRSFAVEIPEEAVTPIEVTVPAPTVTVQAPPPSPAPQVTIQASPAPAPIVPSYLLWTIIGIGAVLVIALIVLIVRTRRAV